MRELQFTVSDINSRLMILSKSLDGESTFGATTKDGIEAIVNRYTQGYGMPSSRQVELNGL